MRRIPATACPPQITTVLRHRQEKLDEDQTKVQGSWRTFVRLQSYARLRDVLAAPLGQRRRCAFCSDSRAADIEHFWPKSRYPGRTYNFENLLLICPECNRAKQSKFPLDASGLPLLVNPAFDDPWDVLFFIPSTGLLDSRITEVNARGEPVRDPRGIATLDVLGDILNSTPVLEGRKANWQTVVSRLANVLSGSRSMPSSQAELFGDDDHFGLGEFLLNREGKEWPEVRAMRNAEPRRWNDLRDLPRYA